MAEIWVRKSLVGVITRSHANEAFALVMALMHASAYTKCFSGNRHCNLQRQNQQNPENDETLCLLVALRSDAGFQKSVCACVYVCVYVFLCMFLKIVFYTVP